MEIESTMTSSSAVWWCLSSDLTELILSGLPLRSIVRAGAVCKHWRSLVSSSSFASLAAAAGHNKPWFFLCGHNNVLLHKNQAFAFDPAAGEWIHLTLPDESFVGSGGFVFAAAPSSSSRLCYVPLLRGLCREMPPLRFPRSNTLVGTFQEGCRGPIKFIVVGGARFIGGLVDIEDRLAVEIFDPTANAWELCPPLPQEFDAEISSQWLSSCLFKGNFYVFGIYSGNFSAFDLVRRKWSEVRELWPAGVLFSFLLAAPDHLVLAGLSNSQQNGPSFMLWKVEEQPLKMSEMAVMPQELLCGMFDCDEDDRFASLKCVGLDGMVYVFNEAHHKMYPACVCEIRSSGSCSWRKLPALPGPLNQFHKVIAFSSVVSFDSVLAAADGGQPLAAD